MSSHPEAPQNQARGTCSNCERDGLFLHKPYNLCSSCRSFIEGVSPYEWERALAKAREKFKGKPVQKTGVYFPRAAAPATIG